MTINLQNYVGMDFDVVNSINGTSLGSYCLREIIDEYNVILLDSNAKEHVTTKQLLIDTILNKNLFVKIKFQLDQKTKNDLQRISEIIYRRLKELNSLYNEANSEKWDLLNETLNPFYPFGEGDIEELTSKVKEWKESIALH